MLGKHAHSDSSVGGASFIQKRRHSPPAKRRHVCSSPSRDSIAASSPANPFQFGCSLPLTQANLQSLADASSSATTMSSRPSSPTRKKIGTVDMKWERTKLDKYNIRVDTASELPAELRTLVKDTFRQDRTEPPSPNAKHMVSLRRAATIKNEKDAIKMIGHLLLFDGRTPANVHGIEKIVCSEDAYLSTAFLPEAPSEDVLGHYGKLTQAQADLAVGYLTRREAKTHDPPLKTAFSKEQDDWLDTFALNQALHLPFLTSQWKTPTSSTTHFHAQTRCARDGVTIFNYLEEFFSVALGRKATHLEAYHVSVTTDIQTVLIWIHWRANDDDEDVPTHYMKQIYGCMFEDEAALGEARKILWNVLEYSLGPRVHAIQSALPLFQQKRGNLIVVGSSVAETESVAASVVGIMPRPSTVFGAPLTPSESSLGSPDPQKKHPSSSKPRTKKRKMGVIETNTAGSSI